MAESFSDIMKKYDDASISDMGNALLARKEQVQSEQRKRDKKDARTQQVLAVLLAGQGLFKNAFKRIAFKKKLCYKNVVQRTASKTFR